MDKTLHLIQNNANLPLSIIIVGVGNDDFNNMRKLDGDENGKNLPKKVRDTVQFVPYRETNNNPVKLAAELLAELPNQVVEYMVI